MSLTTPLLKVGQYGAYLRNISVVDNGYNTKGEIIEEWLITSLYTNNDPPTYLPHNLSLDPTNRYELEYYGLVPKFTGSATSKEYNYYNWRESWTSSGFTPPSNWAYLRLYNDAYSDYVLLASDIETLPAGDLRVRNRWGGYIRGLPGNNANPTSSTISKDRIEKAVIEYSTGRRESVIWRRDWTTPPTAGSDKTGTDIGGNPVRKYSFDGRPQDVIQSRMRIRITKNAQKIQKKDIHKVLASLTGCRNDTAFLDYPAGWLWLDSYQIVDLEGPFYELVFDFVYDEWYEHSQEPELDPDGKPTLDATGTNYADVQWVRMTRPTADFNKIFFKTVSDLTAATPVVWTQQRDLAWNGWSFRP